MAVYNRHGTKLDRIYDKNGNSLNNAYDENGNIIFTRYKPDYTSYSESDLCTTVYAGSAQGFDIYNGVAFQCWGSNDKVASIDVINKVMLSRDMICANGHNNGASFSDEFYLQNDEFPLFYICADNNIVAHRVTRTSVEIVKTFTYRGDDATSIYGGGIGFDTVNDVAYTYGYSTGSWTSSSNNKLLIVKSDFKNAIDNGDGTFTPRVLARYEYPFVYCIQSPHFHDGLLWLPSGNGGSNQHIYGMNPETGEIIYTIDIEGTTEIEGVTFLSDFEMVYGMVTGGYEKITFDSVLVNE